MEVWVGVSAHVSRLLGLLADNAGIAGQRLVSRQVVEVLRHGFAPNWIGLPPRSGGGLVALDLPSLARLVNQGLAVAWIPRPAVLAELMLTDDEHLPDVLLTREGEILDDCAKAVAKLDSGALTELARLLTEAVAAARHGYHSAAQALAANILDTALRIACPFGPWQGYRKLREAVAELQGRRQLIHLRSGLAMAPLLLATDTFDGQSNVPAHFSRHATAHAVGGVQYTRVNSIVAIMVAASALRECWETTRSASSIGSKPSTVVVQ